MGQSLPPAVTRAAPPERPDPLELWRVADRVARQAEVRLAHAGVDAGAGHPARAEALVLRQRANELLRAALGDIDGSVREPGHTAESLRV